LAELLFRNWAIKRFFFPPHFTSASALPGEMQNHKKRIFSLKCFTTALPDFNQSLA